jgi:hypothetical protein
MIREVGTYSIEPQGSFLDDESQMVVDAEMVEIGLKLFEDWNQSNLDEGTFYADYQIACLTDSNYLKGRFNQFYDLNKGDEYYLEWDEEK